MAPTGLSASRISASRIGVGVAAILALAGATLTAAPAQANGCITTAAGTSGDPYLIATEANLDCLMGNPSDYWAGGFYFLQTADLDLTGYGAWANGIGSMGMPFNGTYDGNSFTISHLSVTSASDDAGLFGVISGATIKDVTLVDASVVGDDHVGALVGRVLDGTIARAHADAAVTGANSVGGLVGLVDDSASTTIAQSAATGSVSAPSFGRQVGGLVGRAAVGTRSLTITDSYSSASVAGYDEVGGLVGQYFESTGRETLTITDSYATGATSGALPGGADGGVVGCIYDGILNERCWSTALTAFVVTDTYWDTQTTGQPATAGGQGTGKTTAQMTDIATFTAWSVSDVVPDATVTWGICPPRNGGFPFLQWYAAAQSWSCSTPSPPTPAPVPATPPTAATAAPGDAQAEVT